MTPRKLFVAGVIAALIIGGIWYFIYAQPAESTKVNVAHAQVKAGTSITPSTQVESPKLSPAANPAVAATQSAPTQSPKSTSEIEVAALIDDVATLLQSGDIVGAMEKTESPEVDAILFPDPQIKENFYARVRKDTANPLRQQELREIAQTLLSLKNETPEVNATGDLVTYPFGVVFEKENGIWYIKRGRGF